MQGRGGRVLVGEIMSDNPTQFIPTQSMLDVLKVFQEAGYNVTVKEACRLAGRDRSTYYDWFDRFDGFTDWWQASAEHWFARNLPRVHAAVMEQATTGGEGNPTAAKLFIERFDRGFAPRSKVEHGGKVDVKHDLRDMTTSELLEIGRQHVGDKSSS